MKSSVYEVVDVQSGEVVYVGKANDPELRWATHVSNATSPLIQAMVLNGVDRYTMRVVADLPTANEALSHERSLVHERKPPFNRNTFDSLMQPAAKRVPKVWNGRLIRDHTYDTWFGKWRESVGVWRMKRVPPSIQEHDEALVWFARWLTEQGLMPTS